jgi:predicted transposase
MKQTVVLKLETTASQFQALMKTMEAFNQACQHVADLAYEKRTANKIALQPLVYGEIRKRYGLSSQMVVRSISRACEAYKADKRVHVRFGPHDPMVFDQRILSIKSLTTVSVLTLAGRQMIAYRFQAYRACPGDRVKGQADLLLEQGVFLLHVYVDLPAPSAPAIVVPAPGATLVRPAADPPAADDTASSVRRSLVRAGSLQRRRPVGGMVICGRRIEV